MLPEGGRLHQVSHKGLLHEFCQEWRHVDPVPGQSDGRLKQLGPRQLPVLFVNRLVASQLAGNADPLAALRKTSNSRGCMENVPKTMDHNIRRTDLCGENISD